MSLFKYLKYYLRQEIKKIEEEKEMKEIEKMEIGDEELKLKK